MADTQAPSPQPPAPPAPPPSNPVLPPNFDLDLKNILGVGKQSDPPNETQRLEPAPVPNPQLEGGEKTPEGARSTQDNRSVEKTSETEKVPEKSGGDDKAPKIGDWKPKTARDWDKVHNQISEYRTKLEEAEARLKKYDGLDPIEVVKERDSLKQLLSQVAAERLPENRAAYDAAMKSALSKAEKAVPADQRDSVKRLLSNWTGDEAQIDAFDDILTNASPGKAALLTQALAEASKAREVWDQMTAQSEQNWSKVETARRQREIAQQEAQREQFEKLFDRELKKLQDPDDGIPFMQLKDGDEDHNKAVREAVAMAKYITTNQLQPDEAIRAALGCAMTKRALESHNALAAENATLKAELKKLQAVQPTTTAGGSLPSSTPVDSGFEIPGSAGAGDRLIQEMRKQGLRF